ncbi:RHS repeat-associated core domain-containing protein [Paraflavitalea speifideaquila]|uniref:RHS repeat domain-containing protein n=1 Tax=Paraflavitalea speifideaquila TaxID=3076558 RepID=UPI0028E2AEFC|nr:RHS repeat-associated core domain-containing protein [Paraflavitalea speifideiaquila]
MSNHLGNVLTTISDRKIGVYSNGSLTLPGGFTIPVVNYYEPEMLAANDYYPFGMLSRTIGSSAKYKFGFNGKEKDNSTGNDNYDYGARIYDGRIGRWLSVDAYSDKYPNVSPYCFSVNSPLQYKDANGNWLCR